MLLLLRFRAKTRNSFTNAKAVGGVKTPLDRLIGGRMDCKGIQTQSIDPSTVWIGWMGSIDRAPLDMRAPPRVIAYPHLDLVRASPPRLLALTHPIDPFHQIHRQET